MHQRAIEGMGIGENFLLDHDRAFVLVHVFYWIFDRDDLATTLAVDQVDHVIQCGGLAGASRPGDQKQSIWFTSQVVQLCRQAQLLACADTITAKTKVASLEPGASQ